MQSSYLVNGQSDVSLTPLDRGFAYGDGVFRTLPVRQGNPIGWQLHFRKLFNDCVALNIPCPAEALLLSDIRQLFADNAEGVAKIIVTRGEGTRGYAIPPIAHPNRVVLRSPLPQYPDSHRSEGVRLHLCALRLAVQPRLAGVKHLNRLENVLARMEWNDTATADGLLLDQAGHVIECTMSNLFMRKGRELYTPDLQQCGVAGVTRERILNLAPAVGLDAVIRAFTLEDLLAADEVMICNSLIGVLPVRQLDKHDWPTSGLAQQLQQLLEQ